MRIYAKKGLLNWENYRKKPFIILMILYLDEVNHGGKKVYPKHR